MGKKRTEHSSPTRRPNWHQPVKPSIPESEIEWLKRCDAIDWLRRYNTIAKRDGYQRARVWWMNRCIDIERARGAEGLEDLKRRMNLERVDNPAGLPQPTPVPEPNKGKALGGASRGQDAGQGTGLFPDQATDAGMDSDDRGSQVNGDLFDAG